MPYRKLYKFRLALTFNRDDYWFDHHAYTVTQNYDLSKKSQLEQVTKLLIRKAITLFQDYFTFKICSKI